MKKIYASLLCLFQTSLLLAQVGINTTAPSADAMLDISATDKGILIPRVDIADLTTITPITGGTTEGLLVYNTNTSTGRGFHYWNGSQWLPLSNSTTAGWNLTGNAGTNASTHFLGTTDATAMVLRTNNNERLRVGSTGNLGIGETNPNSNVDIVQNAAAGNSIEITHGTASNTSSALWIRNNGTNRSLNLQNLNTTSTLPAASISQTGSGANAHGMEVVMQNNTAATTTGMFINQLGLGYGHYTAMNATNTNPALAAVHPGTGDGLFIDQTGTGYGIYNRVAGNIGTVNEVLSTTSGTYSLMTAGGTGHFVDMGTNNGTGIFVDAVNAATPPTSGGDVFGFSTNLHTATPTSAGLVYGAAFAANQYGLGHGILINHTGAQGRNAEFNINNTANTDATLFLTHLGQGSAVIAQNQSNSITGTIAVGDFAYTGTDVDDHSGISGTSTPATGWGIGVLGTGNFYGVFSFGDLGASGTKTFIADHPLDPENKLLRHFSIESNEVLNMYRGVATLDGTGSVTVALPDYFDAINTNYSYQLTSIGSAQQPYIAEEIQENSFTIAGAPNAKVSWTVYAERNDAYMQLHPESREAIVNKTGTRQGKYVTPSFYGHDGRALFTKSQEGTPSTITDPYAMNAQVLKRNEVPQPKINSDEELISTQSDKVSDKSENK